MNFGFILLLLVSCECKGASQSSDRYKLKTYLGNNDTKIIQAGFTFGQVVFQLTLLLYVYNLQKFSA